MESRTRCSGVIEVFKNVVAKSLGLQARCVGVIEASTNIVPALLEPRTCCAGATEVSNIFLWNAAAGSLKSRIRCFEAIGASGAQLLSHWSLGRAASEPLALDKCCSGVIAASTHVFAEPLKYRARQSRTRCFDVCAKYYDSSAKMQFARCATRHHMRSTMDCPIWSGT